MTVSHQVSLSPREMLVGKDSGRCEQNLHASATLAPLDGALFIGTNLSGAVANHPHPLPAAIIFILSIVASPLLIDCLSD